MMADQVHGEGADVDGSDRVHEGKVALITGGSRASDVVSR